MCGLRWLPNYSPRNKLIQVGWVMASLLHRGTAALVNIISHGEKHFRKEPLWKVSPSKTARSEGAEARALSFLQHSSDIPMKGRYRERTDTI